MDKIIIYHATSVGPEKWDKSDIVLEPTLPDNQCCTCTILLFKLIFIQRKEVVFSLELGLFHSAVFEVVLEKKLCSAVDLSSYLIVFLDLSWLEPCYYFLLVSLFLVE